MNNRSGIGKQTGSGGAGSKFINENSVPATQGGFFQGEPATGADGLNLQEFADKFLFPATQPTIAFNVNNAIIEKGTNFSQTVNITFAQNDAGALVGYSLELNGAEISTDQSTAVSRNNVLAPFTLQAKASHEANGNISAGTIATALRTITDVIPQWKGQKANNTTLDGLTYAQLNSALTKIVQSGDNTSITVTAGQYGVFISTNASATIIEAGTGFAISPSAFVKRTIVAKLANGDNVTLTEYIINPATGNFTYNLE